MSSKTLAIIPARGGSSRIPRKNLREVGGKPMIAHTIEQAHEAAGVDESVVSTDDEEIGSVAERYGASVPFDRPEALATTTAPTSAVVTHALDFYRSRGAEFETVCLLQVTSPLRRTVDVERAIDRFESLACDALVSVTAYLNPPQWALVEGTRGYLREKFETGVLSDDEYVRSQDLEEPVAPNGAIYVADVDRWRQGETFYGERTAAYEMPPIRSFDVDEIWELDLVRAIFEAHSRGEIDLKGESK